MGLIEKRRLAQLKKSAPAFQEELQKLTGTAIALDIDWESFGENTDAMNNFEAKGLRVLPEIFREIVVDQIGKDAVSAGIKTLRFSQGSDANIYTFTLQDGVLTMPWDWAGWSGSFFPVSVREKIESML